MNLDSALQTFFEERRELLGDMENALLAVEQAEQAEQKEEMINAIFRAAHTIKGSSGLFGLDHIVSFTHVVESVLDQVRAGKLAILDPLVRLLLACCDHIGALVNAVAQDADAQARTALELQGAPLTEQLRAYLASPEVPSRPRRRHPAPPH